MKERLDQLLEESQSAQDGQKLGTAGATPDGCKNHSSKTTSSRLEWNSDPRWVGGQKEIIITHRVLGWKARINVVSKVTSR
jgi:hypothetical protein